MPVGLLPYWKGTFKKKDFPSTQKIRVRVSIQRSLALSSAGLLQCTAKASEGSKVSIRGFRPATPRLFMDA
jgi:hypothetical protein